MKTDRNLWLFPPVRQAAATPIIRLLGNRFIIITTTMISSITTITITMFITITIIVTIIIITTICSSLVQRPRRRSPLQPFHKFNKLNKFNDSNNFQILRFVCYLVYIVVKFINVTLLYIYIYIYTCVYIYIYMIRDMLILRCPEGLGVARLSSPSISLTSCQLLSLLLLLLVVVVVVVLPSGLHTPSPPIKSCPY